MTSGLYLTQAKNYASDLTLTAIKLDLDETIDNALNNNLSYEELRRVPL